MPKMPKMSKIPKRLRKVLITAVKFAIAAALLAFVLKGEDWHKIWEDILGADKSLLTLALSCYFASMLVIALRWWLLLRTQDISIGLWEVIRLTFLGQFFNAVVPGTVGGDLFKAYFAAKHTPHKGAAMITVFVDRLMGLTVLALLASVMLAVLLISGESTYEELKKPIYPAGIALCGVFVLLVFLLSSRIRGIFHLQKIYERLPIAHHIRSAGEAARRFRERWWDLLIAIAITLVAHGLWILGVLLIGKSFKEPPLATPWHHYFVYIPLIYIIGAVPITPGGIGFVEGAYKVFFVSPSVAESKVLALAAIARGFDIIRGLPGVIVVLTGPKLPKSATMEAELAAEQDD